MRFLRWGKSDGKIINDSFGLKDIIDKTSVDTKE